jgi:hypothetical protein
MSLLDGDLSGDIPYEAAQSSSDRNANFVLRQAADTQAPISMTRAQLRAPGNLAYRSRLTFVADLLFSSEAWRVTVTPRRFDQDASRMHVAGFGDCTERTGLAAGIFARHKAKEGHQPLRVLKARSPSGHFSS